MIHALTQRHLLPMMTPAAILRCIGGIDFDSRSSSFFRFGKQLLKKSRPTRVLNAFRQTMIMNHPVHVKVFYTDRTETVYDLSTFLMSEVITSKLDAFVDSSHNLTMLSTFRSTLSKLTMLPL